MDMLEIMQKTEPYSAFNQDMPLDLQRRAKALCQQYNTTGPEESERRSELLKQLFGDCHPLTFIETSFHCDYGFNIHTHGLTVVNYNCVILDTSPVHIYENAFIGPGVCIACAGHPMDAARRAQGILTSAPVTIGKDVWIGANAVICGGVTIGEGSVIGAGSVVTKDIPAGVVAAGVPCRVLRPAAKEDRTDEVRHLP